MPTEFQTEIPQGAYAAGPLFRVRGERLKAAHAVIGIILVVAIAGQAVGDSAASWFNLSPNRYQVAGITLGNKSYLFGGHGYSDEIVELDLPAKTQRILPYHLVHGVQEAVAVTDGQLIYIVGGGCCIQTFDPRTGETSSGPNVVDFARAAAIYHNGNIDMLCHTSGGGWIQRYNLTTQSISFIYKYYCGTYDRYSTGATDGRALYLFRGDGIWRYDPENLTISQENSAFRAGDVTATWSGSSFFVLGHTLNLVTQRAVYQFDPGQRLLTKMNAQLPTAVADGQAFWIGSSGYIGGGVSGGCPDFSHCNVFEQPMIQRYTLTPPGPLRDFRAEGTTGGVVIGSARLSWSDPDPTTIETSSGIDYTLCDSKVGGATICTDLGRATSFTIPAPTLPEVHNIALSGVDRWGGKTQNATMRLTLLPSPLATD